MSIAYNLEGAHFTIVPAVLAKLFGPDGGIQAYSVGFSFIGLASLVNIALVSLCLDGPGVLNWGFTGINYFYATMNLIALLLLRLVFKEEKFVME